MHLWRDVNLVWFTKYRKLTAGIWKYFLFGMSGFFQEDKNIVKDSAIVQPFQNLFVLSTWLILKSWLFRKHMKCLQIYQSPFPWLVSLTQLCARNIGK